MLQLIIVLINLRRLRPKVNGMAKRKRLPQRRLMRKVVAYPSILMQKNINIKSQAKNTPAMSGQNRTSIDMYSSQLTAIDGKINIQAGGDLNFLTADDVSLNTTDISKKKFISWCQTE